MAHPGPDAYARSAAPGPRRVATLARRAGTSLLVTAVPLVVAILAYAGVSGAFGGSPLGWVAAAMGTPLGQVGGLQWAFRVGAVVGLCGVWAYGLALVVEGFFGID